VRTMVQSCLQILNETLSLAKREAKKETLSSAQVGSWARTRERGSNLSFCRALALERGFVIVCVCAILERL